MDMGSGESDDAADTSLNLRPSSNVLPYVETHLCQYCKPLLKDVCKSLHDLTMALTRMSPKKSDFEHVTKTVSESCLMCFCTRHLLPADLPQSATIKFVVNYSSALTGMNSLSVKVMVGWERVLGKINVGHGDIAQHYEPAAIADFQPITRLLHECEEQHLHDNWDTPRYRQYSNVQLIDVNELVVIPATTQYRYVALSYVWGGYDSFASTTNTRASLRQKGGLIQHMNGIPQTIKDAMQVVRNLGERYLWVDRLCIEQDNAIEKETHIQKMDVIYSHALLTIIAHAGVAATSPLPGVQPGTRLGLPTKRIGNFVISVEAPSLWESNAPHETRGWTLQEQLMSQRCLYFDSHTTWFQCVKGICRELDATGDRPYELYPPPTSFNIHSLRSTLAGATGDRRLGDIWKLYATIIERYRTRKLRYVEDTIHAIHGVAQVMSNFLDVPLVSGVPWSILPRALQFYLSPENHISWRNESAPSWSWAGWNGSVYFDDEHIAEPLPIEAVELAMKVQYKAYNVLETPIRGILQPQDPEVVASSGTSSVTAPLYTLLELECAATKAFSFTTELCGRTLLERNLRIVASSEFRVYDQWGICCGYSLGKVPYLSNEGLPSENLQWILLSRSQPIQLKEGYDFWVKRKTPWSTRDIMLIRWSQARGFWERVCIAHVDEDAWEATRPEVTRVLLG